MPPPGLEPPVLWIVAGPNGSGKSTLYSSANIAGFGPSVWIINPDLLSAHIHNKENKEYLKANGEALDRIQDWLKASLKAYQTIGVETVLSTPKYRDLVKQAKTAGFEFRLLYVLLQSVELNIERVRLRAAKGGHDVTEEKIRARYGRSLQQLSWFLHEANAAFIYDNSGAQPRQVGEKLDGIIRIDPSAPEDLRKAAARIR